MAIAYNYPQQRLHSISASTATMKNTGWAAWRRKSMKAVDPTVACTTACI